MKNIIKYFLIGFKSIILFPLTGTKKFIIGLITIICFIPKYTIIGIKYITEKKNANDKKDEFNNKFIPTIIITLSITTYLLCIFILSRWYVQKERTQKFAATLSEDILAVERSNESNEQNEYKDISKEIEISDSKNNNDPNYINTNFINVNLDNYIEKNNETVAWLQVNNTNINYPVVQHDDNSYYLTHDFYQRKTDIGWIFADYRNNFETFNNNTIIYGHNIINRTMFGQIPYLLKKSWFNSPNSHYIKLSTKNTNSIWQIFSVYKIAPTTDYLQTNFNSIEAYESFLNQINERSIKNFNVDLSYKDKIITLSTCDDTGTKRVAVHAKLIKIENK